MSKRIVVGLDGSEYASAALDLALRRAKHFDATLIGVAVVDSPSIEQIGSGAQPGAMHYAESAVVTLMNEAKESAELHVREFRERCEAAGVSSEDLIHTGSPVNVLLEECKTADLLVLGLRTWFAFPTTEADDTLARILQHPIAPVVAVPEGGGHVDSIIFAYDGSPGAARALQAYVHVTPFLPEDLQVSLMCVAREYDSHKYDLERAATFLRAHGLQPRLIVRTGSLTDAIVGVADEQYPSLIILGSPMYRGIGERLFGSVASAVLDYGKAAVFVFH